MRKTLRLMVNAQELVVVVVVITLLKIRNQMKKDMKRNF